MIWPVSDPVMLAPMAGILNLPLRLAFKKWGWDAISIGFIDAGAVVARNDGTMVNLLGWKEHTCGDETGITIQLIGNEAHTLIQAASILEDKAGVFDINLGCPARRARRRGMGFSLLQQTDKALSLLKDVVGAIRKPVTVKVRLLSASDPQPSISFAKQAEDAGVSALIVHGRTVDQGFSGPVDFETVRMMKAAVSIPVIFNGGLQSVTDIINCRERTGCDGVMIGSGAMANPHLAAAYHAQREGDEGPKRRKPEELLSFAGEYASQACDRVHRTRYTARILHYFTLLARTQLYVLRYHIKHAAVGMSRSLRSC